MYADETPVSEVLSAASNLSIFSLKKVIVLKRAETLGNKSLSLVVEYSDSPAPHTYIILVSGDSSKPDFKSAKGIFVKNIDRDSKKIHEEAIEEANRMGLQLRASASVYLCELVGDDLNIIKSELVKIAETYRPGAYIGREEIDNILERRESRGVFDLTNAVADGKRKESLSILAEVASQNQIEPLLIFSAVSSRIRNILRATAIRSNSPGKSPEEQKKFIAKKLKIKPGAAHFLWKQSRNFTISDIPQIMENLSDTDKALKSSRRSSSYEALVRMILNLFAK